MDGTGHEGEEGEKGDRPVCGLEPGCIIEMRGTSWVGAEEGLNSALDWLTWRGS